MSGTDFFCADIPVGALILRENEAAARLKMPRDVVFRDEGVRSCRETLSGVLNVRYAAVRVPVIFPASGVDAGFGIVDSRDLRRNLTDCREAFLLAVTLGHGVDRLLQKLSIVSPAQYFITDALASAYAEAACDFAEATLLKGQAHRPRFSPGYGDLPLTVQPSLLSAVGAGKWLNITLTGALLMSPSKSVTAIIGLQ